MFAFLGTFLGFGAAFGALSRWSLHRPIWVPPLMTVLTAALGLYSAVQLLVELYQTVVTWPMPHPLTKPWVENNLATVGGASFMSGAVAAYLLVMGYFMGKRLARARFRGRFFARRHAYPMSLREAWAALPGHVRQAFRDLRDDYRRGPKEHMP